MQVRSSILFYINKNTNAVSRVNEPSQVRSSILKNISAVVRSNASAVINP